MRVLIAALVFCGALCVVQAASPPQLSEAENQFLFTSWMKQHSKEYKHDEFFPRYNVFKKNLQMIREHNAGDHTYTLGMNEFGDMTFDEFKSQKFGYAPRSSEYVPNVAWELKNTTAPAAVDWRTKNAVTPVKNQQQCGSCWAFSTTGSIEGAWAIAKGKLVSLSEQELVDCSTTEGNQGCSGGLMDNAFKYVEQKGLCTESSYPYKAANGQCQTSCQSVVSISSFKDVPPQDEEALKAAVAIGPVSVAIEADQSAFQFYQSGVFSAACGTQLDHGVLIVGYGTLSGQDYWIVKNSWGATWGLQGYILMKRAQGSGAGECGIQSQPSYPIV